MPPKMQRSGSIERAAALVYRPKDWDKKPEEPTGAVAFDPSLYAGRNIHSYSPSSMGRVALPGKQERDCVAGIACRSRRVFRVG